MKRFVLGFGAWISAASGAYAGPIAVDLGSAGAFAVLARSTVTNTGPTTIRGDLGVSPDVSVTGFPPGIVVGTMHRGDTTAAQAQVDLAAAYLAAATASSTTDLTGTDLGGLTLAPGVYSFATAATLTGTLTLDTGNVAGAVYVFQIGTALTTAGNSVVAFAEGGSGDDVFWQVGSSATLGLGSSFTGNILAFSSITINAGASIGCGRALARNGAVTLDTNVVSIADADCSTAPVGTDVSEPATAPIMAAGLLLGAIAHRRRSQG